MFRSVTTLLAMSLSRGRRILAGILLFLAFLTTPGCANLNLRGDSFAKDETFDWTGTVRQADNEVDFFGFSNKARQIERNFGAR